MPTTALSTNFHEQSCRNVPVIQYAAAVTGEEAVRRYLQFLEDPTKLVDAEVVQALESRLLLLTDPIERLRVLAEIDRVNTIDGTDFEESFILHARSWAESEGIPGTAFRHLGVADDVLLRAGLLDGSRRGRPGRTARTATPRTAKGTRAGRAKAAGDGQRAPWTSTEAIAAWVLATAEPFTLADVQRGAGGSPATVRKAVDELVAAGRVERLGPAPASTGRGRSPIRYQVSR
jgi:predicted ArsR family transcriptional regulator